jgi:hypothetical protein
MQRDVVESKFLSPIKQALRSAMKRHQSCAPSILGLLLSCRPATVARLVVAIHIREAINRMILARPRPHVLKKRIERIQPSFAYGYSPAAVSLVSLGMLSVTTDDHHSPGQMLGSPALPVLHKSLLA